MPAILAGWADQPPPTLENDMTKWIRIAAVLLAGALVANACGERRRVMPPLSALVSMPSPAADGSAEPNLNVGPDGSVYLTWIEPSGDGHALRFATTNGERWSDAQTIAAGTDWFINWADFPTMAVTDAGTIFAHWLEKSGEDTYSYDVKVTNSKDGGQSWASAVKPHRDGTPTEHGFVSMVPWTRERVLLVWLDGRGYAPVDGQEPARAMTLRGALMDASGKLYDEEQIDARTCDCCQTAAVRANGGVVVAYRDRSPDEIRDIYYTLYRDGVWSRPQAVHADGWKIDGCPVNGPALDSDSGRVAMAWYTMARGIPQVLVAMSNDAGATFGPPLRVDDGDPLGRVDVVMLPNGGALVTWIEAVGEGAHVQVRIVRPGGELGLSVKLSDSDKSRESGFPQMVRSGDRVYFAWTQPGEPSHIRTHVVSLAGTGLIE